jgi:cysteine synthase A
MSRGNSPERARQMAAFGAEVVLVDQAAGSAPGQVSGADLALVEAEAERIVAERGAFRAHQFEREGNLLAHQRFTGPELWCQAGGRVDAFVDCPGTCGGFTGMMRYLRAVNPAVRGYIVEPLTAAVLAGKPVTNPRHQIQGAGYSRADLQFFTPGLVNGYLQVSDPDAIAGARALAAEEGIFGGFSSGAHLAAALRLLAGPERGNTVAFVVCDSGLKYLSTDLFP